MACSVNHRESVQIPYKNINDSHSAKLTCFPYIYIYIYIYIYLAQRVSLMIL